MSGLFTDMAGAVIDELEPDERTLVDPKVFTRIVAICAAVAESHREVPEVVPMPPAMQFINAYLLVPGDYLWREDLAFDIVDTVEVVGDDVLIRVATGRTIERDRRDPIRVAISNHKAQVWNQERPHLAEGVVRTLYSTYGAF